MDNSILSIAAIRSLGIDIINNANSGHPGMVLGSAPALYTLFTKEMDIYHKNPKWFNRDRFVLASGHASALLYTLLHLSGFKISMDDLKQFRTYQSITPGHPEIDVTPGVEASTGPLGQGIPMALGMAMAEKHLATRYNREGYEIINHNTFVLCGDGDLQEGVTNEALALAGHYSLGKLIVLYDSNDVTLDGPLSNSTSVNQKKLFEANNWQVIEVADGNDIVAISKAIKKAKKEAFKPSVIIIKTVIGYGSKNQGTAKVHGAPLGKEDGKNAKISYGFDHEEFYVPEEVYDDFKASSIKRGKNRYNSWNRLFKKYKENFPTEANELENAIDGNYQVDFSDLLATYKNDSKEATRDTSLKAIQVIAKENPTYVSGTADLASSTKTTISGSNIFSVEDYTGRNLAFGIREFAMTSIMNGIALHGGMKVSGGGFMVFSDYMKAGIRSAAMMKLPVVFPLSHDSIAVGQDGPTHQPIEHLTMLRTIPNLKVFRPADSRELLSSWEYAIETKVDPTALILTRQALPYIPTSSFEDTKKGGYIIGKENKKIDSIVIATGSEVSLALKAKEILLKQGIDIRVVSMPSTALFDQQKNEYKESVLPKNVTKRLAVEMAHPDFWYKYVGLEGKVMGIDRYGASGDADEIIPAFGYTAENIVNEVKDLVK